MKISVTEWYSIENKKPIKNEDIIYEGNLGGIKAKFIEERNGIGFAFNEHGHIDCFENWVYPVNIQ